MANSSLPRIPIVTIGGFLGAGKTTLVNSLLTEAEEKRLVVFVNDFGAINIDHSLIETVEQDRISLSNGCVCCSLNEDLVSSISQFSKSQDRPDAFIIEASGVADPRALDSSFDHLEMSGAAIVDTRLYVLDADGFGELNYEDSELIIDHAAAADLVILNKCDLATDEKLQYLENLLEEAAPYSALFKTVHCKVSLQLVLSERQRLAPKPEAQKSTAQYSNHSDKYTQWSVETEALIDRNKFISFARDLPNYCLRSKGFLRFADTPNEQVCFNLVGVRASYETLNSSVAASSQLVVIGPREKMNDKIINTCFTETLC